MEFLKNHLDKLYKECEHGDEGHRKWLKEKFNDYYEQNKESFEDEVENELTKKLIEELPEFGIDTSEWEYNYGDCCYGGVVEFLSRCIKDEK